MRGASFNLVTILFYIAHKMIMNKGEYVAASKAQQRAVAKYMAANCDEIKIRVPKGRKADVDAFVKEYSGSINGLVNSLLRETLGMGEED